MKVSLYKQEDGTLAVLVQASVGSGKAPIVLQGLTKESFRAEVLAAIEAQKRPGRVQETLF